LQRNRGSATSRNPPVKGAAGSRLNQHRPRAGRRSTGRTHDESRCVWVILAVRNSKSGARKVAALPRVGSCPLAVIDTSPRTYTGSNKRRRHRAHKRHTAGSRSTDPDKRGAWRRCAPQPSWRGASQSYRRQRRRPARKEALPVTLLRRWLFPPVRLLQLRFPAPVDHVSSRTINPSYAVATR